MWIRLKSKNDDDDDDGIGVNIRQQQPFAIREKCIPLDKNNGTVDIGLSFI